MVKEEIIYLFELSHILILSDEGRFKELLEKYFINNLITSRLPSSKV